MLKYQHYVVTEPKLIDENGYLTSAFTGDKYDSDTTLTPMWTNIAIVLPTPTRANYTCTGWYTEDGTKRGNTGGSYVPSGNETLYARWQPIHQELTVTNTVAGNMGNKAKVFAFTLQLSGTDLPSSIEYTKNSITETALLTNGKYNFSLAHEEQIVFSIPNQTVYMITENNENYEVTKTNDTGILESPVTASFINTLEVSVDTGVENRNQLIFMVILMSLAAIVITIEERKRRNRVEQRAIRNEKDDERK